MQRNILGRGIPLEFVPWIMGMIKRVSVVLTVKQILRLPQD